MHLGDDRVQESGFEASVNVLVHLLPLLWSGEREHDPADGELLWWGGVGDLQHD